MSAILYNTAKRYLERLQWPVIPVDVQTKRPRVTTWLKYRELMPTDEELTEWFMDKDPSEVGLALITGKLSGIVVIDDDFRNGEVNVKLESPIKVKTGGGGYHLYFKYEDGIGNKAHIGNKPVDVRGEGGYVIIPPSRHKSGNDYQWELEGDKPLYELVNKLEPLPKEFLHENSERPSLKVTDVLGTEEGSRNDTLFRFGAKFVDSSDPKELYDAMWAINNTFKPEPLHEAEFKAVYKQVLKYRNAEKEVGLITIKTWKELEKERAEQRELEKIAPSTGYAELDRIIAGFLPGHVYLLTGDTNAGKTTMAANFVERLRLQGKKSLYIALEPGEGLLDYLVAIRAKKNFSQLDPNDFVQTDDLIDVVTNIETIDQLDKTLEHIGANYHFVVIDHVGYFTSDGKNPLQSQADFMKKVAKLSKKHKFAVMPIAHIRKRQGAQKKQRSITIDDILGSASFKQDSTEVLILQRYYVEGADEEDMELKKKARLIVAKTKKGRPGSVWLHFNYGSPIVLGDDEVYYGEED